MPPELFYFCKNILIVNVELNLGPKIFQDFVLVIFCPSNLKPGSTTDIKSTNFTPNIIHSVIGTYNTPLKSFYFN